MPNAATAIRKARATSYLSGRVERSEVDHQSLVSQVEDDCKVKNIDDMAVHRQLFKVTKPNGTFNLPESSTESGLLIPIC